jgi:hypothetical protein
MAAEKKWVFQNMTQHEYVFIAISIILGLAITRQLSSVAGLVRAHKHVTFDWATALWAVCVMLYILQLWWVGWELRTFTDWTFGSFFILVVGAIFIYGAAELSLPKEDFDITNDSELDFNLHSATFGRVAAVSMLGYLSIGPYVNIVMLGNPLAVSLAIPLVGIILMLLIALRPAWFKILTCLFSVYTVFILYLTA